MFGECIENTKHQERKKSHQLDTRWLKKERPSKRNLEENHRKGKDLGFSPATRVARERDKSKKGPILLKERRK